MAEKSQAPHTEWTVEEKKVYWGWRKTSSMHALDTGRKMTLCKAENWSLLEHWCLQNLSRIQCWSIWRKLGWLIDSDLLCYTSWAVLELVEPVCQEMNAYKTFVLSCQVLVSNQDSEEEVGHLGNLKSLLPCHSPSEAYLSAARESA